MIIIFCCVMNFTLRVCFSLLNQLKSLDLKLSCKNSLLQANPVESGSGVCLGIKQGLNLPAGELGALGKWKQHTHKKARAGGSRVS